MYGLLTVHVHQTRDVILLAKEEQTTIRLQVSPVQPSRAKPGDVSTANCTELETDPSQPEDHVSNKRRAENPLVEKEPTKKKSKESKKNKIIAMGGVSLFGGKDLFGGKNPFANRKQEESSEEEEDENETEIVNPENGLQPVMSTPNYNIAIQADAEEKPVSFEDIPTNSHVISSSAKHRVTLPSKRRPPARHRVQTGICIFNLRSCQTSHIRFLRFKLSVLLCASKKVNFYDSFLKWINGVDNQQRVYD